MLIYTKNQFKHGKKKTRAALEYDAWLEKHGVTKKNVVSRKIYVPPISCRREVPYAPSLDTGVGNALKPIEGKRYTGNKIIGIATMHKSNLVPVFDDSACVELASMRR